MDVTNNPNTEFSELIRAGSLTEAREAVQQAIRSSPDDFFLRVLLFQILALCGEWARAQTQLDLTGQLDKDANSMVQTYRETIRCEVFREAVFNGTHQPLIFGDPLPWIGLLVEALRLAGSGEHSGAEALRNKAFDEAPPSGGVINGEKFEWIADADMRLGPICEVILNGRYYWVPFHRIGSIKIEEPADLRDFVWTPAFFTWANGGEAAGFIPTRYPESHRSEDGLIRMAKTTSWISTGESTFQGLGQRMITTDINEYPVMDIRDVSIEAGFHEIAAGNEENA